MSLENGSQEELWKLSQDQDEESFQIKLKVSRRERQIKDMAAKKLRHPSV